MQLKASWLPGGEVELGPLPIRGERELREVTMAYSKIEAMYSTERTLAFGGGLLAAHKSLHMVGLEEAKKVWDQYVAREMPERTAELTWSLEKFSERLQITVDDFLLRGFGCNSTDEAETKLAEMARDTRQMAKDFDSAAVAEMAERPFLVLYWRLRHRVKVILLPEGPVAVSWELTPEARKATMEVLAQVVSREKDLSQLNEAPRRPLDREDLRPMKAADVEGKSGRRSKTSTSSSRGSQPSSASSTATATVLR